MITHYSYHVYQTACNEFSKQSVLSGSDCHDTHGNTFENDLQITHLTYRRYLGGASLLASMQTSNSQHVSISSVRHLQEEVILNWMI